MPPPDSVTLSLKRFLLVETCPADWKNLDLYIVRDAQVTFYVGQSQLAFARLWEHLLGGFKGHSMLGRFLWCNWPVSMNFTLELWSSAAARFAVVAHDLNAAERLLIQQLTPCFNIALNTSPTPLPNIYLPPFAPFRRRRSLKALLLEARRAVQAEDAQRWLQSLE